MMPAARMVISAVAALAAGIGIANAARVVHESLASVAVRAQRIVVAEVLAADAYEEGAERILDVEVLPEQLISGPGFEARDEDTLLCRYREARVQRRGDAVLSPLVSGSGEEFRTRRGDRVILLLAAEPENVARGPAPSPPQSEAEATHDDARSDAETDAQPRAPDCMLLRIESLQNRIAILRHLRHAAEARGKP